MAPFKDDLDGREADLAITFGIDGVLYRIRLSVARRTGMVHLLEPEIDLPEVEFLSRRRYWTSVRDWAALRGIDLPRTGSRRKQ
jgi:hypothetical protein